MRRPAAETEVIAHRGASGYASEHTFAAFDLALEQGADVLEVDVRSTADGVPVAVHDATLLRTTADSRRVDELTAAAVADLSHPARPVPLDDVLERYADRAGFLVDLKDPQPAWEGRVVVALERHGLAGRAVVQSFDTAALERVHRAAPWLSVATLYRRADPAAGDVESVPAFAEGIGPWHGIVDEQLVSRAHERGLAVRPWTVDEPEEARRLADLGADGIITNMPDRVVAELRELPLAA